MTTLLAIGIGLVVGSFLTAVTHRLATGESVVRGRSACPHCRRILTWRELIPLVSFFIQRGRCRECGERISWQYPTIIVATALVFWGIVEIIDPVTSVTWVSTVVLWHWSAVMVAIAVVDLRWMIIPDRLLTAAVIPILATVPFWILPTTWSMFSWGLIADRLMGVMLGAGLLGLLFVFSRGRAMGFGDVKLAGVIGLLVGWVGVVASLILAFIAGGLVGIVLLLMGRATRKTAVPFGPFLAGASIVAALWAEQIEQAALFMIP